jgi:hypothetical protein
MKRGPLSKVWLERVEPLAEWGKVALLFTAASHAETISCELVSTKGKIHPTALLRSDSQLVAQ